MPLLASLTIWYHWILVIFQLFMWAHESTSILDHFWLELHQNTHRQWCGILASFARLHLNTFGNDCCSRFAPDVSNGVRSMRRFFYLSFVNNENTPLCNWWALMYGQKMKYMECIYNLYSSSSCSNKMKEHSLTCPNELRTLKDIDSCCFSLHCKGIWLALNIWAFWCSSKTQVYCTLG